MALRSSDPSASVSRGGNSVFPPMRTGTGRSSHTNMSCNRCHKPLSTTLFVCACDCVFCEECTYSHFNSSSSCPICNRTLGSNDFMELVVADPTAATSGSLKNTFQTMFTKLASESNAISHQEICTRLLKSFDDNRRALRFLLKQYVLEGKTAGRQSGSNGRAIEELKAENTHLKQSASSQRIQTDQVIADLRHRLQAVTGTMQELQKKVEEKDTQIQQFRQLVSSTSEGAVRIPGSSHSHGSGSGRIPLQPVHYNNASPAPPMPGYIMQEQARERAQDEARREYSRSRVPIQGGNDSRLPQTHMGGGGGLSEIDSVITPIQVPPPNHHLLRNRYNTSPSVVIPGTPRIRDLTAGSSYVFTSSSSRNPMTKRTRYDGVPASSSSSISPGGPRNNYGYGGRSGGRTPSYGSFGSR